MRFFKKYRPAGEWTIWFAWYPVWAWRDYDSEDKEIGIVWLEKVWRRRNPSNFTSKWNHRVL